MSDNNISTNEMLILTMMPKHINFVARDEQGDLWGLKHPPQIKEDDEGKFLLFSSEYMQQDANIDDVYSLSVFNHLFQAIPSLGIMSLRIPD